MPINRLACIFLHDPPPLESCCQPSTPRENTNQTRCDNKPSSLRDQGAGGWTPLVMGEADRGSLSREDRAEERGGGGSGIRWFKAHCLFPCPKSSWGGGGRTEQSRAGGGELCPPPSPRLESVRTVPRPPSDQSPPPGLGKGPSRLPPGPPAWQICLGPGALRLRPCPALDIVPQIPPAFLYPEPLRPLPGGSRLPTASHSPLGKAPSGQRPRVSPLRPRSPHAGPGRLVHCNPARCCCGGGRRPEPPRISCFLSAADPSPSLPGPASRYLLQPAAAACPCRSARCGWRQVPAQRLPLAGSACPTGRSSGIAHCQLRPGSFPLLPGEGSAARTRRAGSRRQEAAPTPSTTPDPVSPAAALSGADKAG